MSRKLTNEEVDRRLEGRKIKRLEDYISKTVPIKFQCLENNCNFIWTTRPGHIFYDGSGCSKCSHQSQKLTDEEIDQKLCGRDIRKLDHYINIHTIIRWQCLKSICNHIWETTSNSIINNITGCPKCFINNSKLTDEEINQRLFHREIKKLDNYISGKVNMRWQCLKYGCGYVWKTKASSVLNNSTGCPKCSGVAKITNEDIDIKLFNRGIKRLDNCINNIKYIRWLCLKSNCNYIWKTSPSSILNNLSGCPNCAGVLKLTNKIIDEKLQNKNIKRLENYINSKKSIQWQCLNTNCNHIWKARTDSVLNSLRETGCPKCNNLFKNETLIYNLFKQYNINIEWQYNIKNIDFSIKNYRLDFYSITHKLAIEYNGAQHYVPVCFGGIDKEIAIKKLANQKLRDQYIEQFCQDHNIELIWIDGRKYKNKKLEQFVIDKLIPKLT